MAYQPPFAGKQAAFGASLFTPWSQSLPSLFNPLSASLPPSLSPFAPFHPLLIHQQNNFYNSNFTFPNPLLHPNAKPPAFPTSAPSFPFLDHKFNYSPPLAPPAPAPRQVIEISDDESPLQPKPLVAVVREKPVGKAEVQAGQRQPLAAQRRQKQVIQKGRVIEIREVGQGEGRRECRTGKKGAKAEAGREPPKCKKVSKERFTYKLTEEEKALMKISRYREYRPDLIMVGPQFQSRIPRALLFSRGRQEWLGKLKESLQLRRQL